MGHLPAHLTQAERVSGLPSAQAMGPCGVPGALRGLAFGAFRDGHPMATSRGAFVGYPCELLLASPGEVETSVPPGSCPGALVSPSCPIRAPPGCGRSGAPQARCSRGGARPQTGCVVLLGRRVCVRPGGRACERTMGHSWWAAVLLAPARGSLPGPDDRRQGAPGPGCTVISSGFWALLAPFASWHLVFPH